MSGTNVVALPNAHAGAAPAATPPAGSPTMYPPWAMNPIYPIPPGPWGGTGAPGCAPGCPPNSLMQCYCDIQNATAFISAIMIDLINNNPAVAQAMIDAIVKSGAALPLIGVTNGSAAQPGQVGEFVEFVQNVSVPSGTTSNQTVTMGVLQPGDWDCWGSAYFPMATTGLNLTQMTTVGFQNGVDAAFFGGTGEVGTVATTTVQGLISVPTLIVMQVTIETTAAGTLSLGYFARRMR